MTDARSSQVSSIAVVQGDANVNISQIASIAVIQTLPPSPITSQLAIVAVTYELPYVKKLVPLAMPGYSFSGFGYYIAR